MQQIIADRRALHRIPELDRNLPRTMDYLRRALSALRCQLFSPIEGSLCAWFDNGAESAIAFRSDADALPICEATDLEFASEFSGRMHACGHDGHMAMLLELARRLDGIRSERNYLLIFQPAEETTGGAKDICESGIFQQKHVRAIFGMHIWPDLPAGTIAARENEMMARSCELTLEITGKSCHIARSEDGCDALLAGVEFAHRMAEYERSLPPEVFRVLRFGKMTSGSVRNAVSDYTRMEGSLRAFQDETFYAMLDRLQLLAAEISAQSGCELRLHANQGYPAVMNPPEICARIKACGVEYEALPRPAMTTEDFSWYQRSLPGMFFFLGAGPAPALHSANFNFDESILTTGADFMEKIALNFR